MERKGRGGRVEKERRGERRQGRGGEGWGRRPPPLKEVATGAKLMRGFFFI